MKINLNKCSKFYNCDSHKAKQIAIASYHMPQKLDHLESHFESMCPAHIALVARSCASLGNEVIPQIGSIFFSLGAEVINKIYHFSPNDLETLTCAYAQIAPCDTEVFDALAMGILKNQRWFSVIQIGNIAEALALAKIHNWEVMSVLAQQTIRQIDKCWARRLTQISCAFADLGIRNDALLLCITRAIPKEFKWFKNEDIHTLRMAYLILDYPYDPFQEIPLMLL